MYDSHRIHRDHEETESLLCDLGGSPASMCDFVSRILNVGAVATETRRPEPCPHGICGVDLFDIEKNDEDDNHGGDTDDARQEFEPHEDGE